MKQFINLTVGLNSPRYHTSLGEVCNVLESNCPDEYTGSLLDELGSTKKMLFEAITDDQTKEGIKQESLQLRKSITSTRLYISSFQYDSDAVVASCAKALLALLDSFGPFNRMDVHSRLTQVQSLLDKLNEPDVQVQVDKIQGLAEHIKDIQAAAEALLKRLTDVERMSGKSKLKKSKNELKREAASILERLIVHLSDIAFKDPQAYGDVYDEVISIITSINATYKAKHRRGLDEYEEEYDAELENDLDESTEDESTEDESEEPESTDDPDASATPSGE